MNQYYICKPGGTQEGPYPEHMVRICLLRGIYPAGTLVWREGMANWQNIEQVLPAESPATPQAPLPADNPPAPRHKPRKKKLRTGHVLLTPQPNRRGVLFLQQLLRWSITLAVLAGLLWGANYFYVNYMGGTDYYAAYKAKKKLESLGITRLTYNKELVTASKTGSIWQVKLLLQAGADANSYDKIGWTSLHYAAGKNNIELAALLLSYGADYNILSKTGTETEFTPLITAVVKRADDTLDFLLEAGADPNKQSDNVVSPLAQAIYEKNAPAVRCLLKHGAHVNQKYGKHTPLEWARAESAPDEIVQMLIQAGGR